MYPCTESQCTGSYKSIRSLKQHCQKTGHIYVTPDIVHPAYECTWCKEKFTTFYFYKKHQQETGHRSSTRLDKASKDIAGRPYPCTQCNWRFAFISLYLRHCKTSGHIYADAFQCDQCNERFRKPNLLRIHKNEVHTLYVFRGLVAAPVR